MSAQECPTCGVKPGEACRSGRWILTREHVARETLEFGDWTRLYDALYRDTKLKFQMRRYA